MRRIVVKNLKTEKEYVLDEHGWKAIQDKGWANRYTVVREEELRKAPTSTLIPKELQAAVDAAAAEPTKEQTRGTRKRPAQDTDDHA
jgi:hypothetical protein